MIDRRRSLLLLVIVASAASTALADGGRTVRAVVGDKHLAPDGSLDERGAVLVRGGRIDDVTAADPSVVDGGVDRYPGAVIAPGLIDLRSAVGAFANNDETARAIDPGAGAVDVLNPHHRDFRAALESGITTVMIAPAGVNLVAGVAVVVKTASSGATNSLQVLRDDGPLVLVLGPSAWRTQHAPTSDVGALAMLRGALDDARAGRGHARMQSFASGALDGFVLCDRPMDVRAALSVAPIAGGRVTIVHTGDELALASDLGGTGVACVVGPYGFDDSARTLRGAGALTAAGLRVAFAGDVPRHSSDSLRTTGALAVRHGMSPADARRAMTVVPAELAGVGDRVGAIKPGLDADFVVFSGDPLRLDSRVLAVYIRGTRVYRAAD